MIFDSRPDFRQERIRQRRDGADALVQYDLFDAMDRKENRIRLNSALLMMSDVIHPVFEGIEVDSPDRYAMRSDIQKPSEEPFPGTVKTDDDDGVQLHDICQTSIGLTSPSMISFGSVNRWTPSILTPSRTSLSFRPLSVTSITQSSVTIVSTTSVPVRGSLHFFRIFGWPSFVACSIAMITRLALATRSMAPPMPFIIFPGTIQFARFPRSSTSIAPRTLK